MTRTIKRLFSYLFLIIASFISVFPFYWMIVGATNQSVDITKGKLTFGLAFYDNLKNVFTTTNIAQSIVNSLFISSAAKPERNCSIFCCSR